ncbi:hypothetical protein PsorP6_003797 [Peronosclerospora sorghi]|uniref:Uncharacterized protein n=1 Tax=Peronosclerospora sorghi TaxID=230839 RepID=A0ACC0VKP5_9STRA|nr:hypothetical protein PsorP6_003797 [Peronosclerospora sorghi]
MTTKDITSEFVSITVLFETGENTRPQPHRPLSRDARLAQNIAEQLRQQELCLRELQDLVAEKSIIGDDRSAQIATLTDVLKKELSTVERNILMFQKTINAQRGRHQQHHLAHFTIVCQSLKSRCAKSVKAFHHALQRHTAAIRERSSRRSKFSHCGGNPMVHINAPIFPRTVAAGATKHQVVPSNSGLPLHPPQNQSHRQPLAGSGFQSQFALTPTNSGIGMMLTTVLVTELVNCEHAAPALSSPATELGLRRRSNLGATPFMQQRLRLASNFEDAQTRYSNAAQVESTIVEITGMYTRMATMVAEQGEIISRIDDDIDIAQTNVEAAHGELLKLFNMVQSNRSLILNIFLVLILVIFLFVVVF